MKEPHVTASSRAKDRASHRSRMGMSICGFLVLFAFLWWLCSTYHEETVQGMDWFCGKMDYKPMGTPMMAYVIGCVGLLGLVIAVRSWLQVLDNARQVDAFMKKAADEQWDKNRLVQAYKEEHQEPVGRVLAMRLGVLLGDKQEHEHLRHVVPSLSAMREISLRSELGRSGAAFVGVVVSILLILGIFATLMGVHSVLNVNKEIVNKEIEFSDLATALLPSAIAVALTVALILLRAFYMRAVESLIARIDTACIAMFVPMLYEPAEKEVDVSALGNVVPKLGSAHDWTAPADEEELIPAPPPDVRVDAALKQQIAALKQQIAALKHQIAALKRLKVSSMPTPTQDADHDFSKTRTKIKNQALVPIKTRLAACAVFSRVNRTR